MLKIWKMAEDFQNVYRYNVCLCSSIVLADVSEYNCSTAGENELRFVVGTCAFLLGPVYTMPEEFEKGALFLRLGLPSILIRRNCPPKTEEFQNGALRFSVDRKHFRAFRKQWRHDNQVICLPESSSNTNTKWRPKWWLPCWFRLACSRLSVSEDDRKSDRATSGISSPLVARPLFQSFTLTRFNKNLAMCMAHGCTRAFLPPYPESRVSFDLPGKIDFSDFPIFLGIDFSEFPDFSRKIEGDSARRVLLPGIVAFSNFSGVVWMENILSIF